ncbi:MULTISPECIES: hypothetical protein [Staphylococcus]|uniref:hypothetical protein n=1 Tax=Staphylococcus TaxID=1279 RepID=UPI00048E71E6|nr:MULTISPECIES: hypothetical protein [Staphylococcus]RNM16531.1 hypothetical protein EFY78_12310 [Staphylococcus pasteuri]
MATLPKEVRQKLESNIYIYKVTSKNIYYTIDVSILSQYRKEKYMEGRVQKWNSQQINITDDISTTLEKELNEDVSAFKTQKEPSEITIYSKILSQGEHIIEELRKIKIEINKLELNEEKNQGIIDLTKKEIIKSVNKI